MMLNPFDLSGPEFLALYIFCFMLIAIYRSIRQVQWRAAQGSGPKIKCLPYELACLAGNHARVAEVALAEQLRKGVLVLGHDSDTLTLGTDFVSDQEESPERQVREAVKSGQSSLRALRKSFVTPAEISGRLFKHGVVFNASLLPETVPEGRFGGLALKVLMGIGVIRLVLGITAHRPVAFLVVLLIVTLIVSVVWGTRSDFRTGTGKQLLAEKIKRNSALRTTAKRRADSLSHNDFVLAAGLFGVSTILTGQLAWMAPAFAPPPAAGSSDSSGSSCGGGSSCGSSCGGGCGGCGG